MMERVALSAGRCGSECVEYSIDWVIKENNFLKQLSARSFIIQIRGEGYVECIDN